MQDTTLSGSDTTARTGDGGDLFGREFVLFHSDRLQLHKVRNLYNSGHLRGLGHVNANTGLDTERRILAGYSGLA
jgi:hypothetical protein